MEARLISAQEILDMTDEEWAEYCGCSVEDLDEKDWNLSFGVVDE